LPCNIDGVDLIPWTPMAVHDEIDADIVIEAFAFDLPEIVLQAMARRHPAPIWINLEYLSAQDWVEGCHRMCSPHARLPLIKHFFFPGFTPRTGGLLREPGLFEARDALVGDRLACRAELASRTGIELGDEVLAISMFCYEQAPLPVLLETWANGDRPVALLVPHGCATDVLANHFGVDPGVPGSRHRDRALQLVVLPFTDQDTYDRLLWACDLNFVRGEDSFVRAQWAARPFVWQVYPQHEDAHRDKLEAFFDQFLPGLDEAASEALATFWRAWNGFGDPAASWPEFAAYLHALQTHGRVWAERQAALPDLASALVDFCEKGV
tara:strand:- start:3790 stop:4761 length:972 start_codon:yes stop_codon:yes gene_type:complete